MNIATNIIIIFFVIGLIVGIGYLMYIFILTPTPANDNPMLLTTTTTMAPTTTTMAPTTTTMAPTTTTNALTTVTRAPTNVTNAYTTTTNGPTNVTNAYTTTTNAPTNTTIATTTVKPGTLASVSYLNAIQPGNLIKGTDNNYYYITDEGNKSLFSDSNSFNFNIKANSMGYDLSGFSQISLTYFIDNNVLNIPDALFSFIKLKNITSYPVDSNRPKYPNVNFPDGTIIYVNYKWDVNYYIIHSGFRRPIGLPNTDYFGRITVYGTLNSYDSFFRLPVGTPVNTASDFNPYTIYTVPSTKPLSFYSIPDGNVITNMNMISWNENKPNNMWYIDKGMKRYINDLTGSPSYNNNGELIQINSLPFLGFNTYGTAGNYSIVLGVPDGSHGTNSIFQYIPTGPDITLDNYKNVASSNRPIFPDGTIIHYTNDTAWIVYSNQRYLLSSKLLNKLAYPSTNIPPFLCNIFWDPNDDFGKNVLVGSDQKINTMLTNLENS